MESFRFRSAHGAPLSSPFSLRQKTAFANTVAIRAGTQARRVETTTLRPAIGLHLSSEESLEKGLLAAA